jgi:hypothetical protein
MLMFMLMFIEPDPGPEAPVGGFVIGGPYSVQ